MSMPMLIKGRTCTGFDAYINVAHISHVMREDSGKGYHVILADDVDENMPDESLRITKEVLGGLLDAVDYISETGLVEAQKRRG